MATKIRYVRVAGGWLAVPEDYEDGAPDRRDGIIGGVVGRGQTREEADQDLREQLEEAA